MLSFFFYGTLMDPDLRAAVLGGPCGSLRPAVLAGYRRRIIAGHDYPAVTPARGADVSGLLAEGVSPAMAARASAYEGEQYDAFSLTVTAEDGTLRDAWIFLLVADVRLSARDWSLDAWRKRHKALALKSARADMTAIPAGALRRIETDWAARMRRSRRA